MATNRPILFLALFIVISTLHSAAAHFPWLSFMNRAKDNQKAASSIAESIIQRNLDCVAAVVPIVEIKNDRQDLSKYYKCTMHMMNTGYSYGIYAPESLVTPWSFWSWSGPKQLCPQSGDSPTNYHCEHAVLLVDEKKWERSRNGKIFYSLSYVKEVNLIGHDTYENYFDGLYLLGMSLIRGGRSSNHYDIRYVDASTLIYLNSASRSEVINLSNAVNSKNVSLKFYAKNNLIHGELAFDSSLPARLEWTNDFNKQEIRNPSRVWQIVGRENMPDKIECTNDEMMNLLQGKIDIIAKGLGGNEYANDVITNCKYGILKPFTTYNFTYPGKKYRLLAYVKGTSSSSAISSFRSYSTIEVHENTVTIDIDYQNYFELVLSMNYSPWMNKLTLEIIWPGATVMALEVKGILKNFTVRELFGFNISDDSKFIEFSALYMMAFNSTEMLIPIIEKPLEFRQNTIIDVKKFLMYKEIAGTGLNDAMKIHQEILAQRDNKWMYTMMIKSMAEGEVFYFGSPDDDNFWFVGQVMFIKAQNGADSFKLMEMNEEYVWIDNEADDGLYDTLQIDSGVCNDVKVEKHIVDHQSMPRSEFDLVLECEKNLSTSSVKVVFMNYLKDKSYRHLKIMWDNVEYIILPGILISSGTYGINDADTFSLGRVIDWKSPKAGNHFIIEPANLWILLDKMKSSEIEARKEYSNVAISVKSMNLSIELKDFFKDGEVSVEWSDKFFAVADDLSDDATKIEFLDLTSSNENELP